MNWHGCKRALLCAWVLAACGRAAADPFEFSYDASGNQVSVQTSAPSAPTILRPPVSQLSRVGGSASFSVVATGHPAPTYQWFRDGDDIDGATTPTLFLPNLVAGDFDDYTVTVTNSEDSVTSSAAELILDSDGDHLPDSWELAKFGNLGQRTHGDADGDGITNLEERSDGTEPNSAASRFFKLTLGPGVSADPAMDRYPPGTPVSLSVSPPPGLNFLEWSGSLAGVEAPLALVMDGSKSVAARFSESVLDRRWKASVTERSGAVRVLLRLASGKVLAGGDFAAINGAPARNLARLLNSLSPDPDFTLAPGIMNDSYTFSFDRGVQAVVEQADGRILVAGDFHRINDLPRRGIARLHADGTPNRGFNAGNLVNGPVSTVQVLADGRIAIAGEFTEVGGLSRNRVAILEADGTVDTGFNPGTGFNDKVLSLALDTGNRIVCGGAFTQYAGGAVGRVARLNETGILDAGFNAGGAGANDEVQTVQKLGDGRFALGGKFSEFNGQNLRGMVLLDADGVIDLSFTSTVWANAVRAILPLPGGRFLVGGDFNAQTGAEYRNDLAVLEADGTVDPAFDPGSGAPGGYRVFSLLDLGGGKVLAGGDFGEFSGATRNRLHIFDLATGASEPSPPVHAGLHSGSADVHDLLALPDGKLLAAGAFTEANGANRGKIARFLPSGELDPAFDAAAAIGPSFSVNRLKRRSDGSLFAGTETVLRLLENGAADPSWTVPSNSDGTVYDFVEDAAGRLYVGGYFGTFGGVTRYGLVRLLAGGQIDGTFANSLPQYSYVYGLDLQSDGRIVVAGLIYDPGGSTVVARLNDDGTRDTTFTSLPGTVAAEDVKCLPDDRLLLASSTLIVGGITRGGPFRLSRDGVIDAGFVSGLVANSSNIRRVAPLSDGRILLCGAISRGTVGNPFLNPRQGIAILNEDGSLDPFDPGPRPLFDAQNVSATVRAVAVDSAGRIHGGGRINEFQWRPRAGLVRFTTAPELGVELTDLAPSAADVGQSVTLTAETTALEGQVVGVFFEASREGGPFLPVASASPQGAGVGVWNGTWKPDHDGAWLVRAVATDLRARRLGSTALPATVDLPPTDFDEWASANFTAGELLDPLVSGPEADPDKDGHKNLDEYYSGILPKHPGSLPSLLARSFRVGSQNFPGLVYRARKNAADVSVAMEVSSDLQTWDDDPSLTLVVSRSPDGLGFELIRVRATTAAARTFLRRRLAQAP